MRKTDLIISAAVSLGLFLSMSACSPSVEPTEVISTEIESVVTEKTLSENVSEEELTEETGEDKTGSTERLVEVANYEFGSALHDSLDKSSDNIIGNAEKICEEAGYEGEIVITGEETESSYPTIMYSGNSSADGINRNAITVRYIEYKTTEAASEFIENALLGLADDKFPEEEEYTNHGKYVRSFSCGVNVDKYGSYAEQVCVQIDNVIVTYELAFFVAPTFEDSADNGSSVTIDWDTYRKIMDDVKVPYTTFE